MSAISTTLHNVEGGIVLTLGASAWEPTFARVSAKRSTFSVTASRLINLEAVIVFPPALLGTSMVVMSSYKDVYGRTLTVPETTAVFSEISCSRVDVTFDTVALDAFQRKKEPPAEMVSLDGGPPMA